MGANRRTEKRAGNWCPYCDEELMSSDLPYCQACKLTVFYCPECKKPVDRKKAVCPSCGAEIKVEAAK